MIFKNRPSKNIDVNEIENGSSLEIVYRPEPDLLPSRIFLSKHSAIELANAIRSYLSLNRTHNLGNDIDQIEIGGGGAEFSPSVHITIDHKTPTGEILGKGLFMPESEAETLAKALERWAKHPDL